MEPLSRRTRISYFLGLSTLFIVVIPLALLYATGYRFGDNLTIIGTGGVSISIPSSDAALYINGEEIGVSGLITRSFYVDDLKPGSYAVHVAREGSYPWYKTLIVEPYIVTDARALLIPERVTFLKLQPGGVSTSTASTTRSVPLGTYDDYRLAFRALPSLQEGEEVLPEDERGGLALYVREGNVALDWTRATSSLPSSFCVRPSSCVHSFFIERGKETSLHAGFHLGGVVYETLEGGVYIAEADVRPSAITVPLYPRAGAEFRIVGGELIVKDGGVFYVMEEAL